MKYVLVSGGVISGVGKGVIASSTGLLLKTIGLKVSSIKIDPYLNIDAGTMRPKEHGEVFVLDDGGEVDLDLGNYERYLNITLTRENNITTGKMYSHVIEKERRGDYLGKTVQIVPHLTNAIIEWIQRVAGIPVDDTNEEPDVCIVELGGTVGDIENMPFMEALRGLKRRAGKNNFLQIHVSKILVINGELKTKPTQSAAADSRKAGLAPDLIACRCERDLDHGTIQKLVDSCDVEPKQVISVTDVASLYHVPISLESQSLIQVVSDILDLDKITMSPRLVKKGARTWEAWTSLTKAQEYLRNIVTIVLVGKYTDHPDAYHSVVKSLEHAAMACSRKLNLIQVDSEHLEEAARKKEPAAYHDSWSTIHKADGILVPGGFGERGTEGMISAIKSAREAGTPFLGVCLGMQLAVVEYARNVCGMTLAASEEFNKQTTEPLIVFMPEVDRSTMGATMRLGLRETHFQYASEWSKMRAVYSNDTPPHDAAMGSGKPLVNGLKTALRKESVSSSSSVLTNGTISPLTTPSPSGASTAATSTTTTTEHDYSPAKGLIINERHRHRYEVNPAYVDRLSKAGLHFVGKDDSGERMEILELKDLPWFVGVQFHPEYLSRVLKPSKPYLGFVAAASGMLAEVMGGSDAA